MTQKYLPKVDFISIIVTLTVLLSISIAFKAFFSYSKNLSIFGFIILFTAIFAVLYSFPVAYILTKNKLVIKKILSKKTIELHTINTVTKISQSISFTYSTKGFFGYLGKTMDGSTSYSTSLKNNLLIKTNDNKKIIISPTKMNLFQNELRKRLPTQKY